MRTQVPDKIGGSDGFCLTTFQSWNLENESHYDKNDYSLCIVHWTSQDEQDHPGWFFVLPSLKTKYQGKEYQGIAIKLCHGISIEWDGRKVRHCSTSPLNHKDVQTFGTWFGVTAS